MVAELVGPVGMVEPGSLLVGNHIARQPGARGSSRSSDACRPGTAVTNVTMNV